MSASDFPQSLWALRPPMDPVMPVDVETLDLGYEVAFPFLSENSEAACQPSVQQ